MTCQKLKLNNVKDLIRLIHKCGWVDIRLHINRDRKQEAVELLDIHNERGKIEK